YSGIQRRYNDPCKIWACGTFGKSNSDNGTWIVEIGSDTSCSSLPVGISETINDSKLIVFPNPAREMINAQFDIDQRQTLNIGLYDINGRLIQTLLTDEVSTGEYHFSFNISHLEHGIYLLQITSNKGLNQTKKIVVE